MTADPTPSDESPADRAARIIAQSLAQGLMEAEVIIAADRDSRSQALPPELVETLERFGNVISRLVEHTEQLAAKVFAPGANLNDHANAKRRRDLVKLCRMTFPIPKIHAPGQ